MTFDWDKIKELQLRAHRGLPLDPEDKKLCHEATRQEPTKYLAQHRDVVREYNRMFEERSIPGPKKVARTPAVPPKKTGPAHKPKKHLKSQCPLCREDKMTDFDLHICKLCQVAFRKVEDRDIGEVILWAARQARLADKRETQKGDIP